MPNMRILLLNVGNKNPPIWTAFLDGASRTRTGDLLGAISSAAVADNLRRNWPEVYRVADLLEARPLTGTVDRGMDDSVPPTRNRAICRHNAKRERRDSNPRPPA